MLDFDGVLAPIAQTPGGARMRSSMRQLLRKLARHFPVAIVSGRELDDVRRKVGVPGLIYVGGHGASWQVGDARRIAHLRNNEMSALDGVKRALLRCAKERPDVLFEDKGHSIALHYRRVAHSDMRSLAPALEEVAKSAERGRILRVIRGKKVYEFMPKRFSKGQVVRELCRRAGKPDKEPLYIGDDMTDEDAFKALSRGGAVRVGKTNGSAASFYLARQSDVERFLAAFLAE